MNPSDAAATIHALFAVSAIATATALQLFFSHGRNGIPFSARRHRAILALSSISLLLSAYATELTRRLPAAAPASPAKIEIHLAESKAGETPERRSWITPSAIATAAQGIPSGTNCALTVDIPAGAYSEDPKLWIANAAWYVSDATTGRADDGSPNDALDWRSAPLPAGSGAIALHFDLGNILFISAFTPASKLRPVILKCPGHEDRVIPPISEHFL